MTLPEAFMICLALVPVNSLAFPIRTISPFLTAIAPFSITRRDPSMVMIVPPVIRRSIDSVLADNRRVCAVREVDKRKIVTRVNIRLSVLVLVINDALD
jgi:hypothetical protein